MLHIGVGFGFGKGDPTVSDHEIYRSETELAVMSEAWGYDSVWAVEHHFSDYSFCPDNLLWLSMVGGRTSTIKLGTGAVILPWNAQPIRVAEKLLMLDNLTDGRVLFGMGRGLSRKEFAPFGVPLDETRERFDESAAMIIKAIQTGVIEGDGPFYPQPRTPLKPGPFAPWDDRMYTVAGSHDSMVSGVHNKAGLMSFILKPVDELLPTFQAYQDYYYETWSEKAPPVCLNVAMYCHEDEETAVQRHYEFVGNFYDANVEHYENERRALRHDEGLRALLGHRRRDQRERHRPVGRNYAEAALYGTPQMILDKLVWIQEQMGEFELILQPTFGGMSHEVGKASMDLFAREVMPKAKQHYDATLSVAS